MNSSWLSTAIARIEADFQRSADTHLIPLPIPYFEALGIDFYLKDESTHPTGSLKHRLARSLFLYALCNGWITAQSTVVEASSGSTAVSEAYFARLLGLPFVAVMPRNTSPEKVAQIEFHGGRCHWVDSAAEVYEAARSVAKATNGHYMDQFTYAERATDWRGNNNIAESMFHQRDNRALCALPAPRYRGLRG
jgi:cysteine synthase A